MATITQVLAVLYVHLLFQIAISVLRMLAAHYVFQDLQVHNAPIVLQDFIPMEMEDVIHAQLMLIPIAEHAQALQLALFALQATLVLRVLHVHLAITPLQVANHALL